MKRAKSYQFTVEMEDGKPVTKKELLKELREEVSVTNGIFQTQFYVKLQGRLGKNNPNAWKYRARYNGGIYGRAQCVRLNDSAFADVYVYERNGLCFDGY
jgi:hypothetical protein